MDAANRWGRIAELFERAHAQAPAEWAELLEREEPDPATRAEVLELLQAAGADGFMEEAAALELDDAFAEDAADPLVGRSIGSYRVLGRIGVGGMGVVYEAEQEQPRRAVALKLIRPELVSSETMSRFRRESELLGRLQHPGIAAIFEAGTIEDESGLGRVRAFCAMEFVRGRDIIEWADQERLETRARLELLAQVCDAVDHAHRRGVVHRDLKPANILVTDQGQPKVLDFGIARAIDASQAATLRTSAGDIVGTLGSMSPEQLRGSDSLDGRSDVYSLGVLAYQLLGGRPPFDVRDCPLPEAIRALLDAEATPLSRLRRQFRGDVSVVVAKAMEHEPKRRYATASEFASDLRACADLRPVMARPPRRIYHLQRFVRRNRVSVTVALIAVAMLIGAAVYAAVGWKHASAEALRVRRINGYLTGVLEWFEPGRAGGPQFTLKEALDEASRRLDADLDADPDLAAAVHTTLGERYFALGRYQEAERQARQALTLRESVFGSESPEVAESEVQLGQALRALGRTDDSLAEYRKAMTIRTAREGARSTGVAECLNGMGVALATVHRNAEALPLLAESLAIMRAAPAADQTHLPVLLTNYGTAHLGLGHHDEALAALSEAVSIREAHQENELETSDLLARLASVVAHSNGDTAKAVEYLKRALQIRRRMLPADHEEVMDCRANLARFLEADHPGEAAALREESLEALRAAGRLTPELEQPAQVTLARLWAEAGEMARAAAAKRRAEELAATTAASGG